MGWRSPGPSRQDGEPTCSPRSTRSPVSFTPFSGQSPNLRLHLISLFSRPEGNSLHVVGNQPGLDPVGESFPSHKTDQENLGSRKYHGTRLPTRKYHGTHLVTGPQSPEVFPGPAPELGVVTPERGQVFRVGGPSHSLYDCGLK